MPSNNGEARRLRRKARAEERTKAYAKSGKSVAQREADRGFPAKLEKEGE